jgi:hypothetical protein
MVYSRENLPVVPFCVVGSPIRDPTTAEYSMTRQDMMCGRRMPRHDQPTKDADQQRYDGGAAVRP